MATNILGSFNKIINETAKAIIDSNITSKISEILNTLVNSTFEAVEDTLKKLQDLTKAEESAEPEEPEGP